MFGVKQNNERKSSESKTQLTFHTIYCSRYGLGFIFMVSTHHLPGQPVYLEKHSMAKSPPSLLASFLLFFSSTQLPSPIYIHLSSLVKNPPAMWETWVRSLGWEDPLEEGTATHSGILSMDRGA